MTLPLNLTVWPSHKDGVLLELARETSVRQEDGAGCTLQPGTGAWAWHGRLQMFCREEFAKRLVWPGDIITTGTLVMYYTNFSFF